MSDTPESSEIEILLSTSIEPIIRLEAIPRKELLGRVLAEDIRLKDGRTVAAGSVLDEVIIDGLATDIAEALVYSRPKLVIIDAMQSSKSYEVVNRISAGAVLAGLVPVSEKLVEGLEKLLENNIGADIVVVLGNETNFPKIDSWCRKNGESIIYGRDHWQGSQAILSIVQGTPFIMLSADDASFPVSSKMLIDIAGGLMARTRIIPSE